MRILRAKNRSGITRFSAETGAGGDALGGGAGPVGAFCEADGVAVDRGDRDGDEDGVAVNGDGGDRAGEDDGDETGTTGLGDDEGAGEEDGD